MIRKKEIEIGGQTLTIETGKLAKQADGSVTREHPGTGLGLPISRDLARMLGGSLQLTSPPGEGATFTVILPLEAPERVEPILVPLTPPPPTV